MAQTLLKAVNDFKIQYFAKLSAKTNPKNFGKKSTITAATNVDLTLIARI